MRFLLRGAVKWTRLISNKAVWCRSQFAISGDFWRKAEIKRRTVWLLRGFAWSGGLTRNEWRDAPFASGPSRLNTFRGIWSMSLGSCVLQIKNRLTVPEFKIFYMIIRHKNTAVSARASDKWGDCTVTRKGRQQADLRIVQSRARVFFSHPTEKQQIAKDREKETNILVTISFFFWHLSGWDPSFYLRKCYESSSVLGNVFCLDQKIERAP